MPKAIAIAIACVCRAVVLASAKVEVCGNCGARWVDAGGGCWTMQAATPPIDDVTCSCGTSYNAGGTGSFTCGPCGAQWQKRPMSGAWVMVTPGTRPPMPEPKDWENLIVRHAGSKIRAITDQFCLTCKATTTHASSCGCRRCFTCCEARTELPI